MLAGKREGVVKHIRQLIWQFFMYICIRKLVHTYMQLSCKVAIVKSGWFLLNSERTLTDLKRRDGKVICSTHPCRASMLETSKYYFFCHIKAFQSHHAVTQTEVQNTKEHTRYLYCSKYKKNPCNFALYGSTLF